MTNTQWQESLQLAQPPQQFNNIQKALWYISKGNWQKAHSIVQLIFNKNAAWVHAFIHRVEGDNGNAQFWYRNAGKSFPQISKEQEYEELLNALVLIPNSATVS